MRQKKTPRKNVRIIIVGSVFGLFFLILTARVVYLQVYCHAWLAKKAAGQYVKYFDIQGKRGAIYDAHLREMAVSVGVTSIAAFPDRIPQKRTAAGNLALFLNLDKNALTESLDSGRPFVWVKRQASPKETRVVKDLNIPGVGFIPEFRRYYPNKTLAAQLLGFTGVDGHGLEGLEFFFEEYLRGDAGQVKMLRDALGRGIDIEKTIFPNYSGSNLVLTIDRNVQYIAEKVIKRAVTEFSARSGMAVVMAPKTGAVLAMAHFPFFNPNSFSKYDREMWRNRAVTDAFEPGSTMKIFSATAALEFGGCSPESVFYCEKGKYRIGENTIHDTRPHGWLTLKDIVKYSSNIGAAKVSEIVGPRALYQTLEDFGFGTKTGVGCPGETTGSLSYFKRWSKVDTATIAYGHGVSVSAIQLISAVSAIGNDGVLMKPHVVKAITDQNGREIKSFPPLKVRRVISARTAAVIRDMMKAVVSADGTGRRAALKGYSVCGKTGTSKKIDETGEYAKGNYLSSFVGFVPADDPAVAILVVIDEPAEDYYGGVVAAPAFKKIARETLKYFLIAPDVVAEELTASLSEEVLD